MIRTIHVGYDGSEYSKTALALAIGWARTHQARLLGHAPVDEPFITEAEAMPMGGAYFAGHRDEAKLAESTRRAKAALEEFTAACGEVGVASHVVMEIGDPPTLLRKQAERADLTVLGRRTYFHYAGDDDPCGTSDEVMHHPPRPIVIVPQSPRSGQSVIVAYDGGTESARALFAFAASGLALDSRVAIVTVSDSLETAAPIAQRAIDYLESHGVAAMPRLHLATKSAGELILEDADALQAGLIVMGAFSHSTLHQFVFGSTTKSVLAAANIPVFLFH